MALAAVLLAGCAPPPSAPEPLPPRQPVERAYRPPEGAPPPVPTLEVGLAPAAAIAALAGLLERSGERLRRGTGEGGVAWLALTSSGDPEPFVDCGSLELADGRGGSERVPASRLQLRIPPEAGRREVLLRQLRLDGRLVVTARPVPGGASLEAVASYVLTRTVDRVALDGRVLDSQRQTIGFATGEAGVFDQGLRCRPTGRLEAAVLEAAAAGLRAGGGPAGGGRGGGP